MAGSSSGIVSHSLSSLDASPARGGVGRVNGTAQGDYSQPRALRGARLEVGTQTSMIVDESAGHEWIAAAPNAIVDWLDTHP